MLRSVSCRGASVSSALAAVRAAASSTTGSAAPTAQAAKPATATATGTPAAPATPTADAAAAARKKATASGGIHKLSSNTADASAYVTEGSHEVPGYSGLAHTAFLALHGRRIWAPLLMIAGYYTVFAPFLVTPIEAGLYWTACIVLQRLSVHGTSNAAVKDMTGYTCVVTGGTSGIGLYTARQLLDAGAHVVIASTPGKEDATRAFLARTCTEKASSSAGDDDDDNSNTSNSHHNVGSDKKKKGPAPLLERISFLSLDYNDQLDIIAAAARLKAQFNDRIDLLVNCAGVWKEEPGVTKQGFEEHIGVNFLGPFHFTEALLPSLRRARNKNGRVVYVTCASHNGVKTTHIVPERMMLRPGPDDPQQLTARCYSAAKLGNIYHAQSIANRRYESIPLNRPSDLKPVDVLVADPGFCSTSLTTRETGTPPLFGDNVFGRTLRSLWIKDAYEGSQTVVNCCLRDEFENAGYYHECRLMESGLSKRAQDSLCREEVVRWAMARTIAKYYSTTSSVSASAAQAGGAAAPGEKSKK